MRTALAAPNSAGHTGRMELYTLRLHRALSYQALGAHSALGLLKLAAAASEGEEFIALWDSAALISDGPDGPRVALSLPAPIACGAISSASEDEGPRLEAGAYLFCQGRADDEAGVAELFEWFARESWWARERHEGPLYLRLVCEDGKTAAQVLARKIEG